MYELRDYQKMMINAIFKEWQGHRRVMAQLPTGAGKTVIFSHIARSFLEQGESVLVVAHRKELILQGKEKLEEVSGLECGIIKAGYPPDPHKDIQMASIQSLSRRKAYPEAGLVVIDEAHKSAAQTYTNLIERYPDAYILGMTATPCRSDGQGFKWLFDSLIQGISVRGLIELGHLCRFKLFASKPVNTRGVGRSGGDFNQGQLEARAMAVVANTFPVWQKYAECKQTILFAVSVEHSKALIQQFNERGYKSEHIDGKTPDKEREAIINRFRNKETMILSNVGIFTEGFDLPGIECVHCVRPTMSLSLWLQMVGRGLRPSPGKEHCIIIDQSDNWKTLGLPDEHREWSLDPVSLDPSRYTQSCPECSHIFQPLSHEQSKPVKKQINDKGVVITTHLSICPNCKTTFEWEASEGLAIGEGRMLKHDFGEIVEVKIETTPFGIEIINNLVKKQEETGKKKGWIYFQLMRSPKVAQLSLGDWRYLASILGYREGWAYKALEEAKAVQMEIPFPSW